MSSMDQKLERTNASQKKSKTSLISRLKKGMARKAAITAAVLTTVTAGWGLTSHFSSESKNTEEGKKVASIENRVQSTNLGAKTGNQVGLDDGTSTSVVHSGQTESKNDKVDKKEASIKYHIQLSHLNLNEDSFDALAPLNLNRMNRAQLLEYQYFTGTCARYLSMLNNTSENNGRDKISGQIDPAQRLDLMFQALDEEIQKTGDRVLEHHEDKDVAIQYQILGKVKVQLQNLEGIIKSGKSPSERFDSADGLQKIISQKSKSANTLLQQMQRVRRAQSYDF